MIKHAKHYHDCTKAWTLDSTGTSQLCHWSLYFKCTYWPDAITTIFKSYTNNTQIDSGIEFSKYKNNRILQQPYFLRPRPSRPIFFFSLNVKNLQTSNIVPILKNHQSPKPTYIFFFLYGSRLSLFSLSYYISTSKIA